MQKAKTHTAATGAKKTAPFFSKEAGNGFFGGGKQGKGFFSRANGGVVQTKLNVGQPNDVYEKEADAMADEVVQRKPIFESKAGLPEGGAIQRKCAHCEQEEKLQRKGDGGTVPAVSPGVESNLNSSQGSGVPLSGKARDHMESSFGADFSKVRIHDNSAAAAMNKELHAQAFTRGNDIYFNSGKYDPGSKGGQHLLAHELTHTIQQNGSSEPIQRLPSWDDVKEAAGAVAGAVSSGASAVADTVSGVVSTGVNAVSSGVDAVSNEADRVISYVKTEAGRLAVQVANHFLSKYGGSVKILEGGGIEVRLPEVPLFERYAKTFSWGDATDDFILAQLPVELGEFGIAFLTLFARGEIHAALIAAVGPVKLKDIILTIDPASDFYSGQATLSAPADITGLLELTGILGGSADWNCLIEVIKIEGGLSGTGTAGASTELTDTVLVTYANDEFNFDNTLMLDNCIAFGFDLDALVNLSLVQIPVWSGNWNLGNWTWEKCWPMQLEIGQKPGSGYHGGGGRSGGGGASGSWDDDGGSGYQGGGGAFGGGGATGSWDDEPASQATQGNSGGSPKIQRQAEPGGPAGGSPAGPTVTTPNVSLPTTGGSVASTTGNTGSTAGNQPSWSGLELLKKLFGNSTFGSHTDLSGLNADAKNKVDASCPIKKGPGTKPYTWKTPFQYEDMDGILTYPKGGLPGVDYAPHAHHVWPKNIGGPERQTRLNVATTIHLSVIHGTGGVHDYLSASLATELNGIPITRHKSDPGNQLLIRKMRQDSKLRRKVYRLLSSYYRSQFRNQSSPQLPEWTYLTGLNESVNNIKP